MCQYKEKLNDVLLEPLSNDLGSLFNKKELAMVMYKT